MVSLFRCTLITDLGVGYLATMSTLRKLSLRWCSIRDASIHHIVGMRKLQYLSLAGMQLIILILEYVQVCKISYYGKCK